MSVILIAHSRDDVLVHILASNKKTAIHVFGQPFKEFHDQIIRNPGTNLLGASSGACQAIPLIHPRYDVPEAYPNECVSAS